MICLINIYWKCQIITYFINIKCRIVWLYEVMREISATCQTGFYKSGDMKTCQTCEAGKEPNSDKTACGKII